MYNIRGIRGKNVAIYCSNLTFRTTRVTKDAAAQAPKKREKLGKKGTERNEIKRLTFVFLQNFIPRSESEDLSGGRDKILVKISNEKPSGCKKAQAGRKRCAFSCIARRSFPTFSVSNMHFYVFYVQVFICVCFMHVFRFENSF